jgi:hypothetical protein
MGLFSSWNFGVDGRPDRDEKDLDKASQGLRPLIVFRSP